MNLPIIKKIPNLKTLSNRDFEPNCIKPGANNFCLSILNLKLTLEKRVKDNG